MHIAIIDSGISSSHKRFVGRIRDVLGADEDKVGHGTASAGIVIESAPNSKLWNVKVFDDTLTCPSSKLADAIGVCAEFGIRIANLSLGTTDVTARDDLRRVCQEAVEAGVILVAAEHNLGLESYPAVFPEVIGVTGAAIHEPGGYYYRPGATIECVARGDEQRLCWLNGKHVFLAGNSFAAPHITGLIARWMEDEPGMTLKDVREKLRENALPEPAESRRPKPRVVDRGDKRRDGLEWIKKAVLYPLNKEMHAMIRYPDLLPFEVIGVADHVGKGMVGKDVGEALGLEVSGIKVSARIQSLMDSGADTLILGYVDQLGRIQEQDLVAEYVRMALENGLNVFSFLPVREEIYANLHQLAESKGLRIAYPDVTVEEANQALQYPNQYPQVDVPVVAVLGTSSQQGKFTLQLAMRRRLKELGYSVGQLGTEHHSRLFGMDAAFPIGYASPVRLPVRFHVPYLDYKMREINERADPDLILVGSQSGTIPYDIVEHSTHSIASIPFLFGTKPDACVLVVNSIDPESYIRDTIDAIRSIAKCKTIAIAMSDKGKHIRSAYGQSLVTPEPMSDENIDVHLARLKNRFALPAYCISRSGDVCELVDKVLGYFADETESDRAKEEAEVEYAAD